MGFLDYSGVTKATSCFKTKFAALVNGAVAIAQGGTGATTAANARKNLGTPASSSLATVESSTATASHAKGSHFIVDGELKKATAAIASGESITSSNSTTDTLQGQIDTLRDSVDKFSVNVDRLTVNQSQAHHYLSFTVEGQNGKYFIQFNTGGIAVFDSSWNEIKKVPWQ